MEVEVSPNRDMGALLDLLTAAVSTLDASGADGFEDVYLYVAGRREGLAFTELAMEGGGMWMATPGQPPRLPRFARADENGMNRRALLIGSLCFTMTCWALEFEEVADYLGCGAVLLHRWISQARDEDAATTDMPEPIAVRMRRLMVVDAERLNLGISDAAVAAWVRKPRNAFGARCMLEVILNDGETGFRRAQLWMLNAPGLEDDATLH